MKAFKTAVFLLIFILTAAPAAAYADMGTAPDTGGGMDDAFAALEEAYGNDDPVAGMLSEKGVYGASDMVIYAALSGRDYDYEAYLKAAEDRVTELLSGKEGGYDLKEIQHITLAAMMLGADTSSFGKRPDGSAADIYAASLWDLPAGTLQDAGTEELIYGILILDAGDPMIPDGAHADAEEMSLQLAEKQNEDGSFGDPETEDTVYLTALALQALAVRKDDGRLSECIDSAMGYLSAAQFDEGYFPGQDGDGNLKATAQVVTALVSLEINPQEDSSFIKKGNSSLDGLLSFKNTNGGYRALASDDEGEPSAAADAAGALLSVKLMKEEGRLLYDLKGFDPPVKGYRTEGKDTTPSGSSKGGKGAESEAAADTGSGDAPAYGTYIWIGLAAALAVLGIIIFIKKSGKKGVK